MLQKARLPRLFAEISRHPGAELLHPHRAHLYLPVDAGCFNGEVDDLGGDAALPQFLADAKRAITALNAVMHPGFREAFIAEQCFRGQLAEDVADGRRVEAAGLELRRQFARTVFAVCEQVQGPFADLRRAAAAQASASASASSATTPLCGSTFALMAVSMSAAMRGFSLR